MVQISQLGSTTVVDATKLKDRELGQLLETLAIEAKKEARPDARRSMTLRRNKMNPYENAETYHNL